MLVDVDFLDHWRTRLVVDQLGGDELAPLYILRIWAHCQNRKSVRFEGMTASGLRSLCRFSGDAAKLEAVLIEGGFVARNGDAIEVPKWAIHNANLIASWENGAKGGRPPKAPENPNGTHGKPTGSAGKPGGNPDKTNKTKGDERGDEGSEGNGRIKGDGKTKVCAPGRLPSSPSPLNAGRKRGELLDLSDANWPRIIALAESVARKIPARSTADRRAFLKHAVIANDHLSEHWLMDSVEAVLQAKESRSTQQGHLIGVLQQKAKEQFQIEKGELASMLDSIEIPPNIWKNKGVVEIRK